MKFNTKNTKNKKKKVYILRFLFLEGAVMKNISKKIIASATGSFIGIIIKAAIDESRNLLSKRNMMNKIRKIKIKLSLKAIAE